MRYLPLFFSINNIPLKNTRTSILLNYFWNTPVLISIIIYLKLKEWEKLWILLLCIFLSSFPVKAGKHPTRNTHIAPYNYVSCIQLKDLCKFHQVTKKNVLLSDGETTVTCVLHTRRPRSTDCLSPLRKTLRMRGSSVLLNHDCFIPSHFRFIFHKWW